MAQLDTTKFFISLFKQHGEMPKVWEKALANQGLRFDGMDLVEIEQPYIVSDAVEEVNAVDILLDGIDVEEIVEKYKKDIDYYYLRKNLPMVVSDLDSKVGTYRKGLEDVLKAIRDNNTKKG